MHAASDALFTEPEGIAARADSFSRRVRRRNLIEYAAGALVLVAVSMAGIAAAAIGEWAFALALGTLATGVLLVMRNLHRQAGSVEQRPEEPCLDHLRRQYRRQIEALRTAAEWYVAPLVPGIALLYATVTWKTAQAIGWERALDGVAYPALATTAFGCAVIALNRWAARSLQHKLDALDALACADPRL
jgi:hypothetical protein